MNNKTSSFIFTIIAVILGVTLYKQFDSNTFRFKNNALALVYLVTFVFSVVVIIRNRRKAK